jgi:hypothetical protein
MRRICYQAQSHFLLKMGYVYNWDLNGNNMLITTHSGIQYMIH